MKKQTNMPALKSEVLSRVISADLPSLPHVLVRLMALCQNDNTTISDLAELIEQEPAMTQKMLGIANSPAYHHLGQQSKLDQCLMTIGTHLVRMVIINESVFQNFNPLPVFKDFDLRAFWLHSLKTAIIARKAARHLSLHHIDEIYLYGLLHNIGRLALLAVVPDLYRELFYLPDNQALTEKERDILGFCHTQTGAHLIRHWQLENRFSDSIEQHHEPLTSVTLLDSPAQLVHMANRLANCEPEETAVHHIAKDYSFPTEIAEGIVTETQREVIEAANHLGLDITDLPTETAPVASTHLSPVQQALNQELATVIQTSELGRFFRSHENEHDLQRAALKAANVLFNLNCSILLWHSSGNPFLKIIAADKAVDKLVGHHIPFASQSHIARSFIEKTALFISDMNELALLPEKNMAKLLGGKNWILLPLTGKETCPGLIFASLPQEKQDKLRADKYHLIHFAEQFTQTWNHLQKQNRIIHEKVTLVEEKYQRISREMAHEINNPLAIIKNYLFLLNRKLDEDSQGKKAIAILNEEITRIGTLINEMSDPAYAGKARNGKTDIISLIKNLIALFDETGFIPASTQITTHTADKHPEKILINAPENLLKQIMVNLIKNAVEAMPDGGTIMIIHQGLIEQEGKTYYSLSIKDNGPGIPEHILKNLFLPTVSTKGENHRGLGLSIVYSLLSKIEALVGCHSNQKGTTFNLLLPAFTPENIHSQ